MLSAWRQPPCTALTGSFVKSCCLSFPTSVKCVVPVHILSLSSRLKYNFLPLPNQTAEYLQMKGCTSQWLTVDTEGVIVSPSADPRLNRRLSAGSHAKTRAALEYLKRGNCAD